MSHQEKEEGEGRDLLLQSGEGGLRTLQEEQEVETFGNSTCDSFLTEIESSVQCGTDSNGTNTVLFPDSTCVAALQSLYVTNATAIRTVGSVIDTAKLTAWTEIQNQRGLGMALGYLDCLRLSTESLDVCMAGVHAETSIAAANAIVEANAALSVLIEDSGGTPQEQFTALCANVRALATADGEQCFPCVPCDTSIPGVECCSREDCLSLQVGDTCSANACVTEGNPRFTLSWEGISDLDLHVITPGGFHIDWTNTIDPTTGGELDRDSFPNEVTFWVENVYFPPETAPDGNYTYYVEHFNRDLQSDEWLVQVFVDGTVVQSHTGTNTSERFIFSYTQ
uniref:Uncharacterized protein n=1 Tax=Cyclophora tenuis TaxID=216820 RepID=A0A7S1D2I7_CYCTE